MPLNFVKFFTPSYLFEIRPVIDLGTVKFLLIFFGALVLTAIILRVIRKTQRHDQYIITLFNKYISLLITTGLFGILLVWFRYETVALLAMRMWLVVWVVIFICWLVNILKYQYKVVPEAKEKSAQRKIFNKYLPQKK